jgi:hypothetical protein
MISAFHQALHYYLAQVDLKTWFVGIAVENHGKHGKPVAPPCMKKYINFNIY